MCTFVLRKLTHEIDISQKHWYTLTDKQKLLLVAHELYHCKCVKPGHISGEFSDGCPSTYMDSAIPNYFCAEGRWKDYKKQIAKGCNLE